MRRTILVGAIALASLLSVAISTGTAQARVYRRGNTVITGNAQQSFRYSPYVTQRTRGIKQLGGVPAMGGVRSLPGWGGER